MNARIELQLMEFDEAPMAGASGQPDTPDGLKAVLDEFGVQARPAGQRSWIVGSVLFRQNQRVVFVHDRTTGFRFRLEHGFGHEAFKRGIEVLLRGFGLLPSTPA